MYPTIPYPTLTPSVRGAQDDFNSFLWNVVMLAMGGSALGEAVKSSGLLLSITQARRPAAPAPPSPTRQKRAARVLPAPCCDQDSGSRHRGRPLVILPHNLRCAPSASAHPAVGPQPPGRRTGKLRASPFLPWAPEGRGSAGGAQPRSARARSARPRARRPSRARRRASGPGRSRPRSAAWCSSRRRSSRTRSARSSSCPSWARSARRWRCAAAPYGACAGSPAQSDA